MLHAPPRRRLLAALGAIGTAAVVGGCGFALRQTPPLPFRRIALTGFAERSPLGDSLRLRLADAAQVVGAPGQADVVLQAITDKRERSVVASTAAGQVRELQLRVRFEFRVVSPGGRELVPPTELLLTRDMSYSEAFALAKAQEEAELLTAMQDDIVQQVLRRLAQAQPAGPGAAAPAPRP
ncbi:MAG: LPS assembly lipoprotein LptE [Aquabacterium sp.]|nr:LPS assembly lipoprotein LptE [Aquabacterium sp.]